MRLIFLQTSLYEKTTTIQPGLLWVSTDLTSKALPRHATTNCIVTLQICSTNQLNLTWGTNLTTGMIRILAGSLLSLGTEMREELQWGLKLCVIVTSLCSRPLFFIHPFPHAHICPLYSILHGCGNKVWLLETKPKGQLSWMGDQK